MYFFLCCYFLYSWLMAHQPELKGDKAKMIEVLLTTESDATAV